LSASARRTKGSGGRLKKPRSSAGSNRKWRLRSSVCRLCRQMI
jgi:hypothetical protein